MHTKRFITIFESWVQSRVGAIPRLLICLGVPSEAHKDWGLVGSQISK